MVFTVNESLNEKTLKTMENFINLSETERNILITTIEKIFKK